MKISDVAFINNPCKHTGCESFVCEICGYPDPSKMIAALKEKIAYYEAIEKEQKNILRGLPEIVCSNGVTHKTEFDKCLYCELDNLRSRLIVEEKK